ncbi:MAG: Lrp/AsnC family transcriptional regulator [archaeon]|nr:Lrp/AsnC family transcriptional regulator [Nanoarchaeota archaeon]
MNDKEREIISELRKDARTSLASISHQINMPVSTVYDKINRFSKNGIIKRYIAIVDFSKLGYNYHAKLAVKVNRTHKEDLLLFLQKVSSINSLYEINGGFDFFIETVHKDIKEYIEFLEELNNKFDIVELHEYQVINDLVKENFI